MQGTPASAHAGGSDGGWRGGREGWGALDDDDDDAFGFGAGALPMELLENMVNRLVAQRCRKLEARLTDLQLEVRSFFFWAHS